MPNAIFLPRHHNDENFSVMIAEALAERPADLKLYCNPQREQFAYFERKPRLPGWVLIGVIDKAGVVQISPEAA